MTKEVLIELIELRLPDMDWDADLLAYNIGMGFNQIFYDTFRKDLSNLDLYCKTYLNVAVSKETSTGVYYSVIPEKSFAQFPDPQEGIRRISRMKGTHIDFVPIKADVAKVFDEEMMSGISGIIGYMVTNGRVEYKWIDDKIDNVKMDIVRSFEAYDDEEEIYIPSGQDERLIQLIVNFLLGQPIKDLVDDGNPKTT